MHAPPSSLFLLASPGSRILLVQPKFLGFSSWIGSAVMQGLWLLTGGGNDAMLALDVLISRVQIVAVIVIGAH
jgi:hypothetical protein